jgi:hypothetical protein
MMDGRIGSEIFGAVVFIFSREKNAWKRLIDDFNVWK